MQLALYDLILGTGFFFLGAVLASFIGVLVERVHTGSSWLTGRSCCNSCGRTLSAFDLVPVFSWLMARGKCSVCGCRIPWLYTVSEAVLGALFVLSYARFGLTALLPLFLLILCVLAFVVLYDLRHTVVPFGSSILLIVLGLAYAYFQSLSLVSFGIVLLVAGAIGLFFFLLYVCSGGRAMGLGDSPIALALSLFVGSQALAGLLFSFWIGAAVGIVILVQRPKGTRMGIEVPFVPFLAAGFLLALFTQWNPLFFVFW